MSTNQDVQPITLTGTQEDLAQVVLHLAEQLAAAKTRTVVDTRNTRLMQVPTATRPMSATKRRVLIGTATTWVTGTAGVGVWAFTAATLPTLGSVVVGATIVIGGVFLLVTAITGGADKVLVWGERVG